MKKTFFIAVMVTSSFVSIAQKGNWYLGGVAGFASTSTSNPGGASSATNSWAFGPEFGTFLTNDIQLGIALGLSGSTSKDNDTKTSSSTSLSPTVYARKFFKITDNFSTFAGFYVNYLSGSSTDFTTTPSVETTQTGIGLKLGVGVAFALSPRFTAVGQYGLMGFKSTSNKVSGNDTGTETSFNFGVNTIGSSSLSQGNGSGAVFNIGIYYTLLKAQ